MKYTTSLLLILFLAVAFSPAAEGKLRVVTTTTDLASLVEIIGGDRVDVTSLSRPNQDPHYLDATPGMVMRITRSKLFVENGLELELGWIPEVLRETRNRNVRRGGKGHVNASQGIKAIQIPERIHRDMGDVHPSGNPHYTLDPLKAKQAAKNIAVGLSRVDAKHSEHYQKNLESFAKRADEVVQKWQAKFEPYKGANIIIYHKHFDYLLERLGVIAADSIEPLPGLSPSAGHVARLLSTYNSDSVKAVIMEPWHDKRVGNQIANGIGVPLITGCPAVGTCDGASCILSTFEANAKKLYDVLAKSKKTSSQ